MKPILWSVLTLMTLSCAGASANRKYARAPLIDNPLNGRVERVAGLTSSADQLALSTFDGRNLCFEGTTQMSAAETTSGRYSVVVLNTDLIRRGRKNRLNSAAPPEPLLSVRRRQGGLRAA